MTYGEVTIKTDKNGMGSFVNNSVSSLNAVAQKGEDIAFYPKLNFTPGVSDDPVWFTFDDRKLYKPNETVNVKGYVRILKHQNDTVVPQYCSGDVQWTVYDPRGAELENGTIKLNTFGSFDIKFVLKDNVNLGDARIAFNYRSSNHSHTFQIQEFRRPEFEAKCRYAPTSNHISSNDIGGFFISSVKASYFAGGKI